MPTLRRTSSRCASPVTRALKRSTAGPLPCDAHGLLTLPHGLSLQRVPSTRARAQSQDENDERTADEDGGQDQHDGHQRTSQEREVCAPTRGLTARLPPTQALKPPASRLAQILVRMTTVAVSGRDGPLVVLVRRRRRLRTRLLAGETSAFVERRPRGSGGEGHRRVRRRPGGPTNLAECLGHRCREWRKLGSAAGGIRGSFAGPLIDGYRSGSHVGAEWWRCGAGGAQWPVDW